MNPTSTQKQAIDAVLSIFETGKLPTVAAYATCTILRDGAGISYGKHQCTDRAGSLDRVVKAYVLKRGRQAAAFEPFLPYLAANKSTLERPGGPYNPATTELMQLLVSAAEDPLMREAQDEVFDRDYFAPAQQHAVKIGLTRALSLLVIYDTCIHSGPGRVSTHRNAFPEKSPANGGDEAAWVRAYLAARRAWLLGSQNELVRRTVYRVDALRALVDEGNWDLATPFTCRNVTVP